MIQYESLKIVDLTDQQAKLRTSLSPSVVHLDDPALSVMSDFRLESPRLIDYHASMDDALNEMKIRGVHLLWVCDDNDVILGVIATEDLLGEKPIQLMQQSRVDRSNVTVKMLMTPLSQMVALDSQRVQKSKVGNIVNTLRDLSQHYALVVQCEEDKKSIHIVGLFNTSHICKQLYSDVAVSSSA